MKSLFTALVLSSALTFGVGCAHKKSCDGKSCKMEKSAKKCEGKSCDMKKKKSCCNKDSKKKS